MLMNHEYLRLLETERLATTKIVFGLQTLPYFPCFLECRRFDAKRTTKFVNRVNLESLVHFTLRSDIQASSKDK
jgi:hypothetical protein